MGFILRTPRETRPLGHEPPQVTRPASPRLEALQGYGSSSHWSPFLSPCCLPAYTFCYRWADSLFQTIAWVLSDWTPHPYRQSACPWPLTGLALSRRLGSQHVPQVLHCRRGLLGHCRDGLAASACGRLPCILRWGCASRTACLYRAGGNVPCYLGFDKGLFIVYLCLLFWQTLYKKDDTVL